MELLLFAGALGFGFAVWALALWGSIELLDRHNPYNQFSKALGWGLLHLGVQFTLGSTALLGLIVLVGWCVFLGKILVTRYQLGLLRTLGVLALTSFGLPYVTNRVMYAVFFWSETAFVALLCATPAAILVGWWLGRRLRRDADVGSALPRARVVKQARPPESTPVAAPAPVPRITPPVAPPEPRADGKPSVLT